jgi:hypothetical protein
MLSATKISITVHVRQKAFFMLVRTAQHLLPLLSCSVEKLYCIKGFLSKRNRSHPNVLPNAGVLLEFYY